MKFIIRPAEARDAESIGKLAAEFTEYLRELGDEAEQRFDEAVYLRDGFGANPAFSEIGESKSIKTGFNIKTFSFPS